VAVIRYGRTLQAAGRAVSEDGAERAGVTLLRLARGIRAPRRDMSGHTQDRAGRLTRRTHRAANGKRLHRRCGCLVLLKGGGKSVRDTAMALKHLSQDGVTWRLRMAPDDAAEVSRRQEGSALVLPGSDDRIVTRWASSRRPLNALQYPRAIHRDGMHSDDIQLPLRGKRLPSWGLSVAAHTPDGAIQRSRVSACSMRRSAAGFGDFT
jgi:hypothetical protein